jgi:hypothetical protein
MVPGNRLQIGVGIEKKGREKSNIKKGSMKRGACIPTMQSQFP